MPVKKPRSRELGRLAGIEAGDAWMASIGCGTKIVRICCWDFQPPDEKVEARISIYGGYLAVSVNQG